jgi:hypothetical protein
VLRGGEPALSASGPEIDDRRLRSARASAACARALTPTARGPAPASPAATASAAALSRRLPELLRRRTAGDADAPELALVGVAAGLRTTA